jgi:MarR family multiple antibiotic resistance transcriptional regulator
MAAKSQAPASRARLFEDLLRSEIRIYNDVNDRIRSAHGIALSQYLAMRFIRDRSDARVADLAAFVAIGVGATSKLIDRLVERTLAERVPNPNDRRSSLLALTATGRELTDAAEATYENRLRDIFDAALSPTQLSALTEAMSALDSALERDQVGVPVG